MYSELNGDLHLVELDRGQNCSLGLCLAGNRDLATMSVFVVGYQPGSVAANDGRIRIGDELLEVSCSCCEYNLKKNCIIVCSTCGYVFINFCLIR